MFRSQDRKGGAHAGPGVLRGRSRSKCICFRAHPAPSEHTAAFGQAARAAASAERPGHHRAQSDCECSSADPYDEHVGAGASAVSGVWGSAADAAWSAGRADARRRTAFRASARPAGRVATVPAVWSIPGVSVPVPTAAAAVPSVWRIPGTIPPSRLPVRGAARRPSLSDSARFCALPAARRGVAASHVNRNCKLIEQI